MFSAESGAALTEAFGGVAAEVGLGPVGWAALALSLFGGSDILGGVGDVVGDVVSGVGDFVEDLFGGFFATGTDMVVSKPTLIMTGEAGAERVTVSPLAGAAHDRGGSGVSITINGLSLMDNFSARKLAYELRRIQRG